MDQYQDKIYAVLTGDLIKSSKLSANEFHSVKECLRKAAGKLNKLPKNNPGKVTKGKIDFYRGDGWQLLLTEPKYALRSCLFLRAYLKAHSNADTRISVGVGEISNLNVTNISQSTGKAFELSGTALDELKARKRMTIAFPYYMKGKYDSLISVFELSDAIAQRWTSRQAEAMSLALSGYKQYEITKKLNSKAVGKTLRTSGWYAVESVLERTEKWTDIDFNV